MKYRPCGACRQLVTAAGCEHWNPRPGMVLIDPEAARIRKHDATVRRQSREVERQAKANAREAVREFYDSMGWGELL